MHNGSGRGFCLGKELSEGWGAVESSDLVELLRATALDKRLCIARIDGLGGPARSINYAPRYRFNSVGTASMEGPACREKAIDAEPHARESQCRSRARAPLTVEVGNGNGKDWQG
jgi:hypothetical protein